MADRERVINGMECCSNVQSGWKDAVWVCPACPYAKNDGKPCETLAPLLDEALALLKEQRRRVMTLDEVRAAEVVWLEQCEKCDCAIKIRTYANGIMSFAYAYNNRVDIINIKPNLYGEICRCWTSRPTDEQREATPWES